MSVEKKLQISCMLIIWILFIEYYHIILAHMTKSLNIVHQAILSKFVRRSLFLKYNFLEVFITEIKFCQYRTTLLSCLLFIWMFYFWHLCKCLLTAPLVLSNKKRHEQIIIMNKWNIFRVLLELICGTLHYAVCYRE